MLVPLLYETNRLFRWISSSGDVKPFVENSTEHPHVNYRHIPIHALHEVRRLIEALEESLPSIAVPSFILYAEHDPVVSVKSTHLLMDKLGGNHKTLKLLSANRHGILMDDLGGCWEAIDTFLGEARKLPVITGKCGPCFNPVPSNGKIRCE